MGGMYGSPMGAFNTMRLMNMGGMGMLGDPSLMALQTGMGSGLRMGMGLDRTAGAASFLMQQAMIGSAGGPQQGPSFDASLSDALEDAAVPNLWIQGIGMMVGPFPRAEAAARRRLDDEETICSFDGQRTQQHGGEQGERRGRRADRARQRHDGRERRARPFHQPS